MKPIRERTAQSWLLVGDLNDDNFRNRVKVFFNNHPKVQELWSDQQIDAHTDLLSRIISVVYNSNVSINEIKSAASQVTVDTLFIIRTPDPAVISRMASGYLPEAITVTEEFEIPGTGITLEKGDTLKLKEMGYQRISTRDMDSIDLFKFRENLVQHAEKLAQEIADISISEGRRLDDPSYDRTMRGVFSEISNALEAARARIDYAIDH